MIILYNILILTNSYLTANALEHMILDIYHMEIEYNPLTLMTEIPSLIHYFMFFLIGIIFFKSSKLIKDVTYNSKKILLLGILIGFIAIFPQLYFENTNLYFFDSNNPINL